MVSSPRPVNLQIFPKKLVRDIPIEERDRSPVLLDMAVRTVDLESSCFELNVIFQPIAVRGGRAAQSNYYIATIGAEVFIRAKEAELIDFTKSCSISIEYDLTIGAEKGRIEKIVPELKLPSGMIASIGPIESNLKRTQSSTAKFTSEEALLASIDLRDEIRWNIDTHRGGKAIRDYLIGNKSLDATFRWKVNSRSGNVGIRPEIRFFSSDKRPLSRKQSILMRFVLWKRRFRLANENGFDLSFEETV